METLTVKEVFEWHRNYAETHGFRNPEMFGEEMAAIEMGLSIAQVCTEISK